MFVHRFYQTPAVASVWIDALAAQYGLNPKTVAKWKKRDFVHDAAMGPKDPCSTVLTKEEEALGGRLP